jgi:hypothetical protein
MGEDERHARLVEDAIRLEIEMTRDRDPPVGWIRTGAGDEVEFYGWLELITALKALSRTDRPPDR